MLKLNALKGGDCLVKKPLLKLVKKLIREAFNCEPVPSLSMSQISKSSTLILIFILAASSLIMVETACAQITKPSVPEFTVEYVNHPFDISPTSTIDPYTGKTVITQEGGTFDNMSVEFKIKNQPFTSYLDASGNWTSLYYNIRFKGHYESEWKYYPVNPTDYGSAAHPTDPVQTGARGSGYINASPSDYTVISLPNWRLTVPAGGQVDSQVQALIGHDNKRDFGEGQFGRIITYYFEGESSDWIAHKQ